MNGFIIWQSTQVCIVTTKYKCYTDLKTGSLFPMKDFWKSYWWIASKVDEENWIVDQVMYFWHAFTSNRVNLSRVIVFIFHNEYFMGCWILEYCSYTFLDLYDKSFQTILLPSKSRTDCWGSQLVPQELVITGNPHCNGFYCCSHILQEMIPLISNFLLVWFF